MDTSQNHITNQVKQRGKDGTGFGIKHLGVLCTFVEKKTDKSGGQTP